MFIAASQLLQVWPSNNDSISYLFFQTHCILHNLRGQPTVARTYKLIFMVWSNSLHQICFWK